VPGIVQAPPLVLAVDDLRLVGMQRAMLEICGSAREGAYLPG
jgi:hypothetical protein